jgi:predicted acyl esterase
MQGGKPAPVLLARTPYDKERILAGSDTFDILRAVQAGYTVVVQDVRGRYASEGEFTPHF